MSSAAVSIKLIRGNVNIVSGDAGDEKSNWKVRDHNVLS